MRINFHYYEPSACSEFRKNTHTIEIVAEAKLGKFYQDIFTNVQIMTYNYSYIHCCNKISIDQLAAKYHGR